MPRVVDPVSQSQTMERFIVAGIEAVSKFGIDNISVQYVSELAKGSRPTFYTYFGDISGLLAEMWISKSPEWLKLVSNTAVGHSGWTKNQRVLHSAMSEILGAAHRIPEVNEVVQLGMAAWWEQYSKTSELEKLKVIWLIGERLGVSLTAPIDSNVHQAEFIEPAIVMLDDQIAKKPAVALSLPKLSNPAFQDETLDSKLLQSAIYIIANSGVKAASMARIARRTQVSTGALYPRFSNTQDIVEKSFELAISQVVSQNFAIVGNAGFSAQDFGVIIMAGLQDSRQTWRNFRIEIHLGAKNRPSLANRMKKNLRETNAVVAKGLGVVSSAELAQGPVPYLMHAVGIGFAILQNAGLPVAKADHRTITLALTKLLN